MDVVQQAAGRAVRTARNAGGDGGDQTRVVWGVYAVMCMILMMIAFDRISQVMPCDAPGAVRCDTTRCGGAVEPGGVRQVRQAASAS